MKIITDNAAYVQKNDIVHLNLFNLSVPHSVFKKAFGSEITVIDDNNRYEFVKFEKEEDIKYFENIDWIIDYNEIKDLTEQEIRKLKESIIEEHNNTLLEFHLLSQKEALKNMDMLSKCEILKYKGKTLENFLSFKQGSITLNLPEEAGYKKMPEKRILTRTR